MKKESKTSAVTAVPQFDKFTLTVSSCLHTQTGKFASKATFVDLGSTMLLTKFNATKGMSCFLKQLSVCVLRQLQFSFLLHAWSTNVTFSTMVAKKNS